MFQDDGNENGADNDAPISISSEEADPPSKEATLQRTLTIADTIEVSFYIPESLFSQGNSFSRDLVKLLLMKR